MGLLDNDGFLSALTRLFQQTRSSGSLYLTMKKYNGRKKPNPRDGSSATPLEQEENLCLLRATNGKKTISTVVSSREVTKFQMAFANLLKSNIDGLKRRDKKSAKAVAKDTTLSSPKAGMTKPSPGGMSPSKGLQQSHESA
ncbi:hypothetical protein EMCRGX_G034115 [Ephydatia muelleri]|eukprot:Em0023g26a